KYGLKVLVGQNHMLRRVSITLSIDNPTVVDGDQEGFHDLTVALMANGTSKISKEAFQEEIDFMGARINLHASGASANTLSRYFPRVLELMAEGAIDPNFTQNDFDTQLARFIDGLKSEERSVASN